MTVQYSDCRNINTMKVTGSKREIGMPRPKQLNNQFAIKATKSRQALTWEKSNQRPFLVPSCKDVFAIINYLNVAARPIL